MNASDITRAKQNRVLYQAYNRPDILLPPITTINYCPVSTLSTNSGIVSSLVSSSTQNYPYKCNETTISYELANSISNGKYLCQYPYCSTITEWNTGNTVIMGDCNCKISELTWKNTNPTTIFNYSTVTYSTVNVTSTSILTAPSPNICPIVQLNQGTNFANKCNVCNGYVIGNNACC
jgi:hypothetical protein